MTLKGEWIPYDEEYKGDRIIITRTGYIVDTKTDNVFLSVQAFINFVNKELKQ